MTFPKSSGDALTHTEVNDLYYRILPKSEIGGDGSDGALSVSAGTTNVSGVKNYTTISVSNGATLNIQGPTILMATSTVNIAGAITSDDNTAGYCAGPGGHSAAPGNCGYGGWGGFEWLQYQYRRIPYGGGRGGYGGAAALATGANRIGGGGGGGGAGAYTGGIGGVGTENAGSATGSTGGTGGAPDHGLIIESVGDFTFASTADIDLKGAAGGAATGNGGGGGGGGGSSFQALTLGDLTFTASANINVTGGAGGAGAGGDGAGGGGGSGGSIKFWYLGSLTDAGTTVVTGGAAGAGAGTAGAGTTGIYTTEQISNF